MDKVRDVGPVGLVVLVEAQGRSQAFGLGREPDLAEFLGGQLALAAPVVYPALELVHGDLSHHRVQHVLDLAGQHDLAAARFAATVEHRAEGQHLAEHAGGFGQGQRRIGHEVALAAGQHLMHAVAEFVRQGHDVAGPALVVQQQVGVGTRYGRVGESARGLAGPHRRVDPVGIEEAPADRRQIRREGTVGREHGLARLVPGDAAVLVVGQRRVAVPVVELVLAHPFGLERVVAVREARIGVLDRRDQGLDHVVLDEVAQVAGRHRAGEGPPPVLDLLVLGQGVGDQREDSRVLAQHLAERLGGGLAFGAVAAGQLVEDLGVGQVLTLEWKAQPGHGLVEQPGPGRAAGHVLLVQQPFQFVRELVGAHGPHVAQPGGVARQFRGGELLFEKRVLDPVEFQGEEQGLGRDCRHPLSHGLVEASALGIGHIAGIEKLGIAHDPPEDLVDLLVGPHGGPQGLAVQRRQPAFVGAAEVLRRGLAARQVTLQDIGPRIRVEVAEVPTGQCPEILVLDAAAGVSGRIGHASSP